MEFMQSILSVLLINVHLFAVAWGSVKGVPDGWYETAEAHGDERLTVTFAIRQTNTEWLEQKLKEVSYPDSPHYTDYMNFDEIAQHVYGRPDSVEALRKTLVSVNIDESEVRFTLGRDFAVVDMPVVAAKQLFSAEFYHYQHESSSELKTITSPSFEFPKSLVGHVDFVLGISSYPKPHKNNLLLRLPQSNIDLLGTTPLTVAKLCNTSEYLSTNADNSQAVVSFSKQYYSPADLTEFQKRYKLPIKPITKVVGKNIPDNVGSEANLDVQYISATGRGVSTWFISISTYSNGKQEDFLSWMINQINTTDSPWVHSVSYGDEEGSIDLEYIQRLNNEFIKFGISGRTILFASGDSGVACKRGKFTPNWPISSPYVTAVGGTISLSQVWSFGGGGFSNVFPMPDYQKQAVNMYLKNNISPTTSVFNQSGRAYPDISSLSTDFAVIYNGTLYVTDGTSCSTPTVAGIISSLNDIRLNNGKKTLGFLNPLLYQTLKGQGFFDITEGANGGSFLCEGFQATKGWDPASGWGSPDFGVLRSLV